MGILVILVELRSVLHLTDLCIFTQTKAGDNFDYPFCTWMTELNASKQSGIRPLAPNPRSELVEFKIG